jgi:hypothetical protein
MEYAVIYMQRYFSMYSTVQSVALPASLGLVPGFTFSNTKWSVTLYIGSRGSSRTMPEIAEMRSFHRKLQLLYIRGTESGNTCGTISPQFVSNFFYCTQMGVRDASSQTRNAL